MKAIVRRRRRPEVRATRSRLVRHPALPNPASLPLHPAAGSAGRVDDISQHKVPGSIQTRCRWSGSGQGITASASRAKYRRVCGANSRTSSTIPPATPYQVVCPIRNGSVRRPKTVKPVMSSHSQRTPLSKKYATTTENPIANSVKPFRVRAATTSDQATVRTA